MSNSNPIELTDALAAGVFRAGLKAGVLNLPRLVEWADLRMVEQAEPAPWLIDLSMAQPEQTNDIVATLKPAAQGVSNETVARAGLALLDLPADRTWESAQRLFACIRAYAQHSEADGVLAEIDGLHDESQSLDANAATIFAFAGAHQDAAVREFFKPVVWDL